jgi:hypothetical protein
MDRRPKTYGALADRLGVEHCRGMRRDGTYCYQSADHRVGDVTPDGVIHWADRRMEWPGLVRFLKLVAISRNPKTVTFKPWQRVYLLNMHLKGVQQEASTRIPTKYLRADRAFVRASVASLSNDVPLRKKAFDWSRREAGSTWD